MEIKKTEKKYILIFAILSIVFFAFLFINRGLIDDGAFHIARLSGLADEISLKNLKPAIYSNTYFGLGYPLGIFYPDIFMYPFAILVKIGLNLYAVYMFMLMCINFFTGLSMYYAIKKIFKYEGIINPEKVAFIVALMYFIYPYRLWDLFFRMAIGESMAFIFIPFVVLGVYEIFYQKKVGYALFLGMTGIAYSHILSIVIVAAALIVYYLLNIKKIIDDFKIVLYTVINAVFTILSTLMITLPIIEMQSFTKLYYQTGIKTFGLLKDHTVQFIKNDYVSLVITIIMIILFIVGYIRLKSRKTRYVLVLIFNLYLCTSAFAWGFLEDMIPALNTLQFPWRLLLIGGIPTALLFGKTIVNDPPIYIAIVIMMWLSVVGLSSITYIPIDDINLYGEYSVGKGEYLTAEEKSYLMDGHLVNEVYTKYKIIVSDNNYEFETASDGDDRVVVIPKGYYKGYRISDSENVYDYEKSDEGMIKVRNPKSNTLTVEYIGTALQKITIILSILSFIGIMAFIYIKGDNSSK